ncbi:Histidine kinase [Hymenobacter gelipurpurascens]|uniref:Oxygen sensor histidine kinase NreB n=1 Tax=Hymenobacter gelipurpurascens TaxID=89968 RepID=A0A212UHB5_9BACT|nr:ATP-binding protein [Hymenobacter gelipurpurascens]SNC77551.1 Histidine kinase [Hymenobacter gelipurpurascens]
MPVPKVPKLRRSLLQAPPDNQVLLEAVFDNSPLALHVMRSIRDAAGTIVDFEVVQANAEAERQVGYSVLGLRMRQQWPTTLTVGLFAGVVQTVETRQPLDLEQYYEGEGVQAWYRWTAVPLNDGAVVSVENISPRKQAEAELLALQLGQQRQLANAVLEAQEAERQRMAEGLHNGICQLLYAAKLHLEQMSQKTLEPVFAESQRKAVHLLSTALTQTRELSHQLVPLVLLDFGLAEAVRRLCLESCTANLKLQAIVAPALDVPIELALPLYRMMQELVANIIRHAAATQGQILITTQGSWLELRVRDNGQGFDPAVAPRGLGVRSVQDRVKLLGGQFVLSSSPGDGTWVTIRVPHSALTN